MYHIVQFSPEDGGSVSIVHEKWLTPRKTEVYWPPVKEARAFDKLLCQNHTPDPKWKTYHIQRTFYETNELEKAKKKLKLVEVTSDIQTDADEEIKLDSRPKRQSTKSKRLISSSDNDDYDESGLNHPPPLKKQFFECNVKKTKLPSPLKSLGSSVNFGIGTKALSIEQIPGVSGSGTKALSIEPKLPENTNTKIVLTDTIISLLSEIKVQNQKIIAMLTNSAHTYYEPLHEDFKFPIQNEEEMITTETLLAEDSKRKQLVSYLKSLGGREVKDKVTRLMKFTLADNLARQYNYYGKRSDKKPFSESRLRHCVIEAVKATTAKVTDREIEDTIKNWLKHAPEREKKRLSRNASQEEQQD